MRYYDIIVLYEFRYFGVFPSTVLNNYTNFPAEIRESGNFKALCTPHPRGFGSGFDASTLYGQGGSL